MQQADFSQFTVIALYCVLGFCIYYLYHALREIRHIMATLQETITRILAAVKLSRRLEDILRKEIDAGDMDD